MLVSVKCNGLLLWFAVRSKAYLFAGVEIRWRCDPSLASADVPESAVFQFPGGLADHLAEQLGDRPTVTNQPFTGRQDFPLDPSGQAQGSAEWAVAWPLYSDGSESYYCNTIPTPDGGTHEAGLRAALTKGIRGFGELVGAVFPGGSVTGAPKISALDHIAALEPVGRGASMGALGRSVARNL